MNLQGKFFIDGKIKVKTGLHIGGPTETLEIGGVSNPVIRTKAGKVYIPGSSLKGKIRSLLERKEGNIKVKLVFYKKDDYKKDEKSDKEEEIIQLKELNDDLEKKLLEEHKAERCEQTAALPDDCGSCEICKIFGPHNSENIKEPIRVIVRDSESVAIETEKKYENIIDRVKGTAQHPREIERVPEGTEFNFEIIFNIYQENDIKLIKKFVEGMELLEDDYLGGSGSRGYGEIEFTEMRLRYRSKAYYEGDEEEKVKKLPGNGNIRELKKLLNKGKLEDIFSQ